MKYLILILFAVLASCRTQDWAIRSQATIHQKFPELEAKNCADRFPIVSDSVLVLDTLYIETGNIDYTETIDSLYGVAMRKIKPLPPNDTCVTKVAPYIAQIKDLQGMIIQFKNNYKAPDSAYRYINIKTIITQESTAKIRASNIERDKYKAKSGIWQAIGLIFICISVILGLALWFKRSK